MGLLKKHGKNESTYCKHTGQYHQVLYCAAHSWGIPKTNKNSRELSTFSTLLMSCAAGVSSSPSTYVITPYMLHIRTNSMQIGKKQKLQTQFILS
jgi:hypothetical protein